jgi:hypothetical protein
VGGYTYVTRAKGRPAFDGEPPALTKASETTIALTAAGLGHQHQSNWVSLIRDAISTPGGSVQFVPALTPGTPTTPPAVPAGQRIDLAPKAVIKHNGLRSRKAKPRFASGLAKDDHQVVRVEVAIQTKSRGNICRQLLHSLSFSSGRHCGKPRVFFVAKGTTRWTWRLTKRLKPGYYVLYARATDNAGHQQVDFPVARCIDRGAAAASTMRHGFSSLPSSASVQCSVNRTTVDWVPATTRVVSRSSM